MAMDKGDEDCTSGLSKRLFDAWKNDDRNGFVDPLEGAAEESVKALCWSIAQAVYDEITENAETDSGEGIS